MVTVLLALPFLNGVRSKRWTGWRKLLGPRRRRQHAWPLWGKASGVPWIVDVVPIRGCASNGPTADGWDVGLDLGCLHRRGALLGRGEKQRKGETEGMTSGPSRQRAWEDDALRIATRASMAWAIAGLARPLMGTGGRGG